ncbi:hypothetical protein WMY93_020229 [Mugilogobius chulae]|uniref:Uncharacterized protein n=1 Tax=Mugilogobius chulae TaxID=88201 RepID=A0AAW0NND5_9GOBI
MLGDYKWAFGLDEEVIVWQKLAPTPPATPGPCCRGRPDSIIPPLSSPPRSVPKIQPGRASLFAAELRQGDTAQEEEETAQTRSRELRGDWTPAPLLLRLPLFHSLLLLPEHAWSFSSRRTPTQPRIERKSARPPPAFAARGTETGTLLSHPFAEACTRGFSVTGAATHRLEVKEEVLWNIFQPSDASITDNNG